MKLQDMFAKPIDRDIKGVIKVGQSDDENIRQELEEYVVTKELLGHFSDFFEGYKSGIGGNTDKMGVWISGFFGSGKSHLLKILSYLLDGKEIDGKIALEYFTAGKKIEDNFISANMKRASDIAAQTDVILFNIDSKSDTAGSGSKDAIVRVFLKVFNEKLGFSSNPHIADLERGLTEKEQYEAFQSEFEKSYGSPWSEARNKFGFIQDEIVGALSSIGFMSEDAARNWCESATEDYKIDIESFAKLVAAHIKNSGDKDHHVVFLVDEIGQYIGSDSKLMLNLQTVTEDLGTFCKGKAWVVVTSQEDIDSIMKNMSERSNDFSKIQGRFDTRLSLSSANVDEVIKKRILAKTDTASRTLELVYDQKETIIKNLITFNDEVEKKRYADGEDFVAVYPFVPYQFDLLASVLTSIRKSGASGKHLSDGERSMLALFKESAVNLKNREEGVLVPFNMFYDELHQFLDHDHKGVIERALDNTKVNPDGEEECFAVNVLKTLFMIKYVDDIVANPDNITTLMADNIDTDRAALKKQVEQALKVLSSQNYVQKTGEIYLFLTNEEQEINREIDKQNIETSELTAKIAELIFDDIYKENKCRYSNKDKPSLNGRYNFSFNRIVDDVPYRANQTYDIGVKIITPMSETRDEHTLRMISGKEDNVLIVLPDDRAFIDELRSSIKIEKFLKRDKSSGALARYEEIKITKNREMTEYAENARMFLTDALRTAEIYVNGDLAKIGAKDEPTRIGEALDLLVTKVYFRLPYIDTKVEEADIRRLFTQNNDNTLKLEGGKEANAQAADDILKHIARQSDQHSKTSVKTLLERYMKAPYGFVENDVKWIIANLFCKRDIAASINGENITPQNKGADELFDFFTKKQLTEKLLLEKREKAGENQIKAVQDIMKEVWNFGGSGGDEDVLMQDFQNYCERTIEELKRFEDAIETMKKIYAAYRLPGGKVIAEGKTLLRSAAEEQTTGELFAKVIGDRDTWLDFAEDWLPVKEFFNGQQRELFEKALEKLVIFDTSRNFFVNKEVEDIAAELKSILTKEMPYADISKLPDLTERFIFAYSDVLKEEEAPTKQAVEEAKDRVLGELTGKSYRDDLYEPYKKQFSELSDKATSINNVADLLNIKIEADALKWRLLNEINEKDDVEKALDESLGDADVSPTAPDTKIIKRKNIGIRSVSKSRSWQIRNEEDIDKYIDELKEGIRNALEKDTELNIEL